MHAWQPIAPSAEVQLKQGEDEKHLPQIYASNEEPSPQSPKDVCSPSMLSAEEQDHLQEKRRPQLEQHQQQDLSEK
jgi:hypothetical protein